MKIKTVVFWILWVGNDLTLQTVGEQNPDPASPLSFPSRLDDADLVSQALGLTATQKEQVHQLTQALRPQRTKLDALQNVVDVTHNDFGMVRTGINFTF
jgi:hypothetical protein